MPPPQEPFVVTGGCNCKALRYKVSVPAWEHRTQNPYRTPGSELEGDHRTPMVAIDHCNDCRRAAGAILPVWFITNISWVTATCLKKDGEQSIELSGEEAFDFEKIADFGLFLTFYKSSPKRSRWFCSRCGTQLAYTIDPGVIPDEWGWPKMLDVCLGTVDREVLERGGMAPERQLWCEKGVPWVRELARHGAGGIPEHPTTKIDEELNATWGIDEVVEEARSHLVRVTPEEARAEFAKQTQASPVALVDIRPVVQREEEGMIDGALIVERNVLEWRFDPKSDAKLPIAGRYDLRVIVFCQEGYTSSLAARALQMLGLKKATDIAGGFKAWENARLPLKAMGDLDDFD